MSNLECTKEVNDLLSTIKMVVDNGVDLVAGNMPEVIEQLLTYSVIDTVTGMIYSWLLALACIAFAVKANKLRAERPCDDWFIGVAFGSGLAFGFSTWFICSTLELIKITLMPKLWLIEYAASLIK